MSAFLMNLNHHSNIKSFHIDLFFISDFNIYVNNLNISTTFDFFKVLNTFNLIKYISFPTHDSKHILDLIITNVSFKLITGPIVLDIYF